MPDRGDLVLVPYPFTDLSATKRRPVLVLTAADRYGDFTGLPVTSRPQSELGLAIGQAEMTQGRLPAASWVRTDRIVTLSTSLVIKVVGRVSEQVVALAAERFCAQIQRPPVRR